MPDKYITFGDCSLVPNTIRSVRPTVDVDGNECVLVEYGLNGSIILYDDAAEQALVWAQLDSVNHLVRETDAMPQPMQYAERTQLIPSATRKVDPEKRKQALQETTIDNIGRPDDLSRIDAKCLWDLNHYRVNVYRYVGGREKMTDSYFIEIFDDRVVASPPMERIYMDDYLDAYKASR